MKDKIAKLNNKKMHTTFLIVLVVIVSGLLSFAIYSGYFSNFGFKLRYSLIALKGSKDEMDFINKESVENAKKNKQKVLLLIHGAGSNYYDDVFGTVKWFKEGGANVVSFDYDFMDPPEDSVKKLSAYIDDLLMETGTEKVDIYGICLGGILARHYAQDFGGSGKIGSLVTVLSPAVPIPETAIAYKYDKIFAFDPAPWNVVLERIKNVNPVKKHIYLYCKKDIIVPTKYQHSEVGNYVGFNCGHAFVNENLEILQKASEFLKGQ